ncbi:energy transducer TonB [Marinigracilibium pacificum]|uniref:Energy transducer TonB n=1 Tax=Marinigracilibium pacificum TaxID=2729599 RepID=A0A848IZF6_9BACT|nr:energy transducer TonB [Marinigracilibium pacificum]NMM48665.1 energy transducer TonB [Marinigracilibium pacificum]
MEVKKSPKADLERKSPLFLSIGYVITLAFVLFAFEYGFKEEGDIQNFGSMNEIMEETIDIPITEQPPPPPPKIQQPEIIEVPDEEEIEEEIEVDLDVEIDEETVIEEVQFEAEPVEEEVEQVFTIVEESAGFPGGMDAWYTFLKDNLKYPSQARRMGIEGRVYVEFIVSKTGQLSDIRVVKGIGGGCDEEAVRVLKQSPRWQPGKQRGRPVIQKMTFPIMFKLQ